MNTNTHFGIKHTAVAALLVTISLFLSGCSGPMVDALTSINAIHEDIKRNNQHR